MVPVRRMGNAGGSLCPEAHCSVFRTVGWFVDSEPRFLYSCGTRAAKELGTIPESINLNVIQTLAGS
jgi:hypothetical protein